MPPFDIKKLHIAKVGGGFPTKHHTGETHFSPIGLLREEKHFGTNNSSPHSVKCNLHAVRRYNDGFLYRSSIIQGRSSFSHCGSGDACSGRPIGFNCFLLDRSEEGLSALPNLIVVP